ncbi:hypothetical protein SARC_08177 [Sphaeroforma arctica JP610]|uniref:Uncharacterized protein n=1 Tax=Sphaeroforma arctica JP610 TaxID=667725 RepID=A0A0L0FU23_9EUKA|nr:hypothetical protein SARC_08177 [Sphaeroforma arctica JP610]KNC79423.1 hypothetical protein SARC_08177 [Sphaeroforma arctica JP610]|eukprot:XP_014153325.1 hypothetical protein SARC_08177 [Sphaeroforma arctica JP610]
MVVKPDTMSVMREIMKQCGKFDEELAVREKSMSQREVDDDAAGNSGKAELILGLLEDTQEWTEQQLEGLRHQQE